MARTSWKQVRIEESLYRGASVVAAADGRSVTNWIERTLKPIVAAELGDESANGAAPAPADVKPLAEKAMIPEKRGRKPKPARWMGCAEHPKVRAVQAARGEKMICGEPGCPNLAREVQS
jgi:hypothetical protein